MSKNVGRTMKTLAIVSGTLGIIVCMYFGISIIAFGGEKYGRDVSIFLGLLTLIGGSFSAFVGAYIIYGFGELIISANSIERMLFQQQSQSIVQGDNGVESAQA